MKKILSLILATVLLVSCPALAVWAEEEKIQWTESEIAFIENNPVVRLGVDPQFAPFEFIDTDGSYKGVAADYISLISQKTGLRFEVQQNLTWPEAYDLALAGEIDVLPAISQTYERESHFLFSEPYYFFKRVIVTRNTDTEITGIEDLDNQIVAVQRNSSHHSYLLSHPQINLSLYDSVEVALTAVADGTERVFVGNLATSNYLIRSTGLTNLKFIAFEAEKQLGIHFAIRQDWPELVSIINKVLHTIPIEDKLAISNKWIGLEQKTDYGPILRIFAIVGILAAVVITVSLYWIIRLRKEIRVRQKVQIDLEKAKVAADEANEFKSSFMARMSHEIRTPLNAITGMSYLLKKTDISLTQSMYIDKITQAASNMLSIINDILDFAKIEAGKVELEETSFNLDQVVQNVVNIVSYKIEEQKIGFKLAKDPQVPNWLIGDPKRIEQVLLNILNNAAKFTSTGEVSLDLRLIAKEKNQCHLSFTIKDTGIGMTDDQVKGLFEPFTQADSSITRRFGGSGLGLSIVKHLLDLMAGKIQVFSTPGEGTTFIIQLTLLIDTVKEAEYRKTLSANQFKNIRTLVLEKTGANMNLIESYLGAFGMHCELTSSEASALSMLEAADGNFARPFDLFIIDYETPMEGGFKFIESLRDNNKVARIPKFIILLPMMRYDLFDKLGDYGIDIGIGKPIIPSILFNAILEIFKLRAVSAVQAKATKEKNLPRSIKAPKVLVADDNSTNQLIARSLLQQEGIETMEAENGQKAVDLFMRNQKDIGLILMDLHMPVMDGYEAAEKIRKISADVPIIAMTADVILGVREKCERSGIYQYISKPFDPDQFLMIVNKTIAVGPDASDSAAENQNPVLDRTAGIRNLGGNKELYDQVLEEYFKENQKMPQLIASEIENGHYDNAAGLVHKIKSSSGSIGAGSLYKLAIDLQAALKKSNEEAISSIHKKFSASLLTLLQEIANEQN